MIDSETIHKLYLHVITQIPFPEEVVREGYLKETKLDGLKPNFGDISNIEKMMATDMINYLPDDILTKVDRASMSNGLEVRVPFLDHEFANWAKNIPINLKTFDGNGKWPLRKLLSSKLPENLFKKPKKGFGIPLDIIINNDLKELVYSMLSKEIILSQGIFNLSYIENCIDGIANKMQSYKLIVIKSTVPTGTGEKMQNKILSILRERKVEYGFDIASNPTALIPPNA